MKSVLIVLVALLALVATFAVQNPGVIVVRFLTFSGYTSLLVVIVASFAAGVLGGWLAGLPGFFRRRSEAGVAARRIRELEAEVGDLKKAAAAKAPSPQGKTP
ncbi:MAG TPA: LapA family protein [Thermodesulfobacteriota bacterium]|nr:LapA family protein [Deltaproteobacteria bacterium]HQU12835.1 LapA family protein [Thermodesulfobacteriota bacterium]